MGATDALYPQFSPAWLLTIVYRKQKQNLTDYRAAKSSFSLRNIFQIQLQASSSVKDVCASNCTIMRNDVTAYLENNLMLQLLFSRPDKSEQCQAGPGGAGTGEWRPQGRSFCFCSANVCLLPDSLARFNNLSNTHRRALEVGKRIRNGASRPQIKIYIDSPTNTSIRSAQLSATGWFQRRGFKDPLLEKSGFCCFSHNGEHR